VTFRSPLLALALALSSLPAQAASYRVDLIVFRNLWAGDPAPAAKGQPVHAVDLRGALDPAAGTSLSGAGIRMLPESDFALEEEWSRLRNSQQFRPVLRLSYVQDDPPPEKGPRVRIATPDTIVVDDPERMTSFEAHAIDGSIALYGGELLHVEADLQYTGLSAQPPLVAPLDELRRVLKGDLHYLDNRYFGVLVRVADADAPIDSCAAQ